MRMTRTNGLNFIVLVLGEPIAAQDLIGEQRKRGIKCIDAEDPAAKIVVRLDVRLNDDFVKTVIQPDDNGGIYARVNQSECVVRGRMRDVASAGRKCASLLFRAFCKSCFNRKTAPFEEGLMFCSEIRKVLDTGEDVDTNAVHFCALNPFS